MNYVFSIKLIIKMIYKHRWTLEADLYKCVAIEAGFKNMLLSSIVMVHSNLLNSTINRDKSIILGQTIERNALFSIKLLVE
jgi:hypothetical protein